MGELDTDRLIACIEDGHRISAIETEDDLRRFFRASATRIGDVMGETADEMLSRWDADETRVGQVRDYLLWEYIAYNIAELYGGYDMVRDMFELQLKASESA